MKVLIDISEEMFKATQTYYSDNTTRLSIKNVIEKVGNGTPISDNATNGDMIKAMFPSGKYGTNGKFVHVFIDNQTMSFDLSWWNAPYKRGGEDGSN